MQVTASEAALEAQGLSKRYGRGPQALRDVSLAVSRGTITALVGPNAAGKSTLMKAWVAFEKPTSGFVRVLGIDPWRERSRALARIGYVPQRPALYRGITVGGHLDVAAHIRPGFDIDGARQHLLALDVPLSALPMNLSGGQQAQVMLALALGTRADVLLLDEPLASLDPLARSEFLSLVRSAVSTDGATAVLSSHVVADIEQACDHLIVLGRGRVLLDQPIRQLRRDHFIDEHRSGPLVGFTEVGTFADRSGHSITLVRLTDGRVGHHPLPAISSPPREASLEEVVMGYLAAGRRGADT